MIQLIQTFTHTRTEFLFINKSVSRVRISESTAHDTMKPNTYSFMKLGICTRTTSNEKNDTI